MNELLLFCFLFGCGFMAGWLFVRGFMVNEEIRRVDKESKSGKPDQCPP